MPQIANLAINDGLATPVLRTFVVDSGQQGITAPARWNFKGVEFVQGWTVLTHMKRKAPKSPNTNMIVKVEQPKLATVGTSASGLTPAPTRLFSNFAKTEFSVNDGSSAAEVADLVSFQINALIALKATIIARETNY